MLWNRIAGASQPPAGIQYVGGKTGAFDGGFSSVNVTLSGLTGGIGSSPGASDIVVVSYAVASRTEDALTIDTSPTGYTELTKQKASNSYTEVHFQTCYKIMSATPDTSLTFAKTNSNISSCTYTIQVFKYVDAATPIDVSSVYSTDATDDRPDPSSVTPVTEGAWIVVCGGGCNEDAVSTSYINTSLENFITANATSRPGVRIGAGIYKDWVSGSYDPLKYEFGSNEGNGRASASTTLVLRPK